MGNKRISIANLPPEVSNDTLRATLAPYEKLWIYRTSGGLKLIDMLWLTVYYR
jgi:hypothetical protein